MLGPSRRSATVRKVAGRLWRSPAVRFAALGALLYWSSPWWTARLADKPRLAVPASRISEAERLFAAKYARPPAAADRTDILDRLVDEEVLFLYALELGLHDAEVPRRRLAAVASFVEPVADEPLSSATLAELARRAVELGLHEGDFVTRRVLVDAARRLIRGAGRLEEPSEEAIEQYLERHAERFRGDDTVRISHVLMSHALRPHPADDAAALLVRLRRDGVSPQDAAALADPGIVPAHLPLLAERAVERRFGPGFAARLRELPSGEWSGPVDSRHGAHLVFVHERRQGEVPEVAQVRDKVRALLREDAADRRLAERLRQLRGAYDVVVESGVTS